MAEQRVNKRKIETVTDMMRVLAHAIESRDFDTIEYLHGISRGWVQSDEETLAQTSLIAAVQDVLEDLARFEELEEWHSEAGPEE